MGRAKKILMVLVALAAVLVIVVVLVVRPMGSKFDPPEAVAGADRVYRVRNNVVDFYTARLNEGATDGANTGANTSANIGTNTSTNPGTNTGAILFDAGLDSRGPTLDALLAAAGSKREDVTAVFITHGHADHIAGALLLPQAKVYASALEAGAMLGDSENKRPLPKILRKIFGVKPVKITDTLEGRVEIPVAGERERVLAIPLPGHTTGSYVFVFRGVLFAGDAFNYENGVLTYPLELVTEDMAAARHSIAQLSTLLQGVDVKVICTGHGGCTPPDKTRDLLDVFVKQASAGQ